MADFKNYDPGRVVVSFRGIQLLGYMDGTFISADRSEDGFEMAVGAGGDVTRVRNRNRSGTVTVTLKAESPTNDSLSAIAAEDELFGTGYGALQVLDLNGTTILDAPIAWIQKVATVEYADTASGREWIFACSEINMFVGGAVV